MVTFSNVPLGEPGERIIVMTYDVLVPDDQEVAVVLLDGKKAPLLSTSKAPGMAYQVRRYACDQPPKVVEIRFK